MKIDVETKPTMLIHIDPTKELTEEIIPTFELTQKIPPPPGEFKAKASKATYLSFEDLLIQIPKILKEAKTLNQIKGQLNWDGQDNQDPEILEALENLVMDGKVSRIGNSWVPRKTGLKISLRML